jgi:hypothetical protein
MSTVKLQKLQTLNDIVWKTYLKRFYIKKLQFKYEVFNYKLLFKALSVKENFYISSLVFDVLQTKTRYL